MHSENAEEDKFSKEAEDKSVSWESPKCTILSEIETFAERSARQDNFVNNNFTDNRSHFMYHTGAIPKRIPVKKTKKAKNKATLKETHVETFAISRSVEENEDGQNTVNYEDTDINPKTTEKKTEEKESMPTKKGNADHKSNKSDHDRNKISISVEEKAIPEESYHEIDCRVVAKDQHVENFQKSTKRMAKKEMKSMPGDAGIEENKSDKNDQDKMNILTSSEGMAARREETCHERNLCIVKDQYAGIIPKLSENKIDLPLEHKSIKNPLIVTFQRENENLIISIENFRNNPESSSDKILNKRWTVIDEELDDCEKFVRVNSQERYSNNLPKEESSKDTDKVPEAINYQKSEVVASNSELSIINTVFDYLNEIEEKYVGRSVTVAQVKQELATKCRFLMSHENQEDKGRKNEKKCKSKTERESFSVVAPREQIYTSSDENEQSCFHKFCCLHRGRPPRRRSRRRMRMKMPKEDKMENKKIFNVKKKYEERCPRNEKNENVINMNPAYPIRDYVREYPAKRQLRGPIVLETDEDIKRTESEEDLLYDAVANSDEEEPSSYSGRQNKSGLFSPMCTSSD